MGQPRPAHQKRQVGAIYLATEKIMVVNPNCQLQDDHLIGTLLPHPIPRDAQGVLIYCNDLL